VISVVAITDAAAPVPEPPLRAVSAGSLSALVVPAGDDPITVDALTDREELLEALMEERDLLPVRFGTDLADERAAERVLTQRHDELRAALDRVRGAVELSVRVQPAGRDDEPLDAVTSGHEYLQAQIARAGIAEAVHEPLAALARSHVTRSGPELLRAAYLVDRDAVPGFVAEVRRLQAGRPELAFLCTGPWAPFSFVAQEEEA
jgi:hypothetical protein